MKKPIDYSKRFQAAKYNITLLFKIIQELFLGMRTSTFPWPICTLYTVSISIILIFKIDLYLISQTPFRILYPYYPFFYKLYAFSLSSLAFWIWAGIQVKKKNETLKLLTQAFKSAGIISKLGRLPQLISDYPLDPMTRKMRLTNAGFPLASFRDQSSYVESELGIFIDEIKENRETRTVELIYSHFPLATEVPYSPDKANKPLQFLVGKTRANHIITSFRETPHLLIAGQTGGGKSTFLRQLIVHTYLQKNGCKFLLIDLKGGLDFSMFENRKNFTVVPHVLAAVSELKLINTLLDERMSFLKENQCKDIEAFFDLKTKLAKTMDLSRQIIVVDEAAEMFLAGYHAKSKEVQTARGILSRIARQGRALGIHLVVATQRPDSKSLDPQVKANLTGVICFQMMNDASSIAVLGTGRATDLPKVPGRAIWKNGVDMIEVQTPYLSAEAAESLLGLPDKEPEKPKPQETKEAKMKNLNLDPAQTE